MNNSVNIAFEPNNMHKYANNSVNIVFWTQSHLFYLLLLCMFIKLSSYHHLYHLTEDTCYQNRLSNELEPARQGRNFILLVREKDANNRVNIAF